MTHMTIDKRAQERLHRLVAGHLDDLCMEIEDDLDDTEVTAPILLAVLVVAINSSDEELFRETTGVLQAFEWKDSAERPRSSAIADGRVSDFGDHVFTRAADFLSEIMPRIVLDTEQLPTLAEFCKLLVAGAEYGTKSSILRSAKQLKPRIAASNGSRPRAKIGDIVEIPASAGGAYRAVIVAKNSTGTAYGLIAGPGARMRERPVRKFVPAVFYSGEYALKEGRWKIVGHDHSLLDGFPADPELYLRKQDVFYRDDPRVGPFGAAVGSDGKYRQISEGEAEEVGLLSGDYDQCFMEEQLEAWLDTNKSRLWPG